MQKERWPMVTTSDLSRAPGRVLRRVQGGERLLVCRHKEPVATIQPLDGFVFQPFTGTGHDVFGWPIGSTPEQVGNLDEIERMILRDCIWNGVVRWKSVLGQLPAGGFHRALEEMTVMGLLRKTYRGRELTARGLALREWLLREADSTDLPEYGGSMLGFWRGKPRDEEEGGF